MLSEAVTDVVVGRDSELTALRKSVADVAAGRGRSVWVEGEPGIGKSALLAAGLAGAGGLGCHVLWAGADEVGGRFPLRVLLDCLRGGSPVATAAAYRRVAGLLRGESGAVVATPADAAAMAAECLLDAVQRLCVGSPVVLVADDLQWADEVSLSVWGRLHTLVGQLPLLLVGVCRPVPARVEVAALRRGLVAGAVVLVELGPLAPVHVREMVAGLVGAAPGPGLLARAGSAAGNPLYVRELVDALVRDEAVRVGGGVAEVADPAGAVVAPSLAAAIAGRLGFLSEPAVRVLRVAALLGVEFSVDDLTMVTGQPATALAPIVDEAMVAGVVAEAAAGLVFRHGLIRQALYEATPSSLRSALHRQAAQALAAAGVPVERVAAQLLAAPQVVDSWMITWVVDAAPALTYRAPQIAVELLTRIRGVLSADDSRRERVDAGLASALFMLARYDEVEPVARPVLASTSDPELAGQMTWTLAYAENRAARHEAALDMLDAALRDGALPAAWRARAQALRAAVLVSCDRAGDAEIAAARAEADGIQADDRVTMGFALHALSLVRARRGEDLAALEAIDQALAVIGQQPQTTDLRLMLLGNRMAALVDMGRMAEAERVIGEALLLAEHSGNPPRLVSVRIHAADICYVSGRWDDALAELTAAAELPQPPTMRLVRHGLGALIASHRDDRPAVDEHVRSVMDLDLRAGDLHYFSKYLLAAQAVAAERDGQPDRALALNLSAVDMIYLGTGGEGDVGDLWLASAVRLALAIGDTDTARGVSEAADSLLQVEHRPHLAAAALHCRGLLEADPALVLAAAADLHSLRDQLDRAQALENAAVLLAQKGQMAAARSAYAEALDIYRVLDAAWDIRRADARLRPLGLQRGPKGPRRRPATGWGALTPSELAIAGLVAAGRSNPDIAAELFLSRRTVQTHVSHILAKLGARSRVDIARAALSREATDAN